MLSTREFLKRIYDRVGGGRTAVTSQGETIQPGYEHCPNVPRRVP